MKIIPVQKQIFGPGTNGSNYRTKLWKGHNLYHQNIKFSATSVLRDWLGYILYQCDIAQVKNSLLNDKCTIL